MTPAVSLGKVSRGLEGFSEEAVMLVAARPLCREKAVGAIHFLLQMGAGCSSDYFSGRRASSQAGC